MSHSIKGAGSQLAVFVSISGQRGSLSNSFSFASPIVINSSTHQAATLSSFIRIAGSMFGVPSFSAAVRLARSATESSTWYSDSSSMCEGTSMNPQVLTLRISVNQNVGFPVISPFLNASVSIQNITSTLSGSNMVYLIIAGAGSFYSSAQVFVGNSNSECTLWTSSSSINMKLPRQSASHPKISISLEYAVSSQAYFVVTQVIKRPAVIGSDNLILPVTASFGAIITGSDFGTAHQSGSVRLGRSHSRSSNWLSDSGLFTRIGTGSISASVIATADELRSSAVNLTLSFLSPLVFAASLTLESVRTGQFFLDIAGTSFGIVASTMKARVRNTAATACFWYFDSAVSSKTNGLAAWPSFIISQPRVVSKSLCQWL
jgi:hypothetical protein